MRNWIRTFIAAGLSITGASLARAEIVEIQMGAPEPFANGATFGSAGGYVRIKGVAKGELDPKDPRNKVITDLDKAPLNAKGRVEYETDVFILRPADSAKVSGVIVYDVTNRGRKMFLNWLADAVPVPGGTLNDPKVATDAGNGFAFDRGHTLVWSGWDPDSPKANAGMTIRVPVATDAGKPITGRIRHEFQIATRGPGDGKSANLPYPAVTTDTANAKLVVRSAAVETRKEIPTAKWEFANATSIRLKDGAAFEPVKIYEFWYEATNPKILGIGYAATRDVVSFLRNDVADAKANANPLVGANAKSTGVKAVLAIGISQSGRYLRHHLDLGMNADTKGRRVFDGVFAHISGAGKVFANHRFGQPGRTVTQHEDREYPENWFPFGYRAERDPFSGKTGRLITGKRTDPKIIETNTSTEYWQKGASLVHTDPLGKVDALLPPDVRVYLIAGTQHGGRAGLDSKPGLCAMPRNPHNAAPALRALLVALEDWVVRGRVPAASRVPTLSARTAVPSSIVKLPKVAELLAHVGANPVGPPVDWVEPPAALAKSYAVLVPDVDADGNERAGLRLPPISVPLGTYTGWNLYKAAPTDMCDRDGALIAFAATKAEREAKNDPRPSLAERYKSADEYVTRVKAAADRLVKDKLLLPADAAAYVDSAKKVTF